jgi:hypothetical protein
VLSHDLAHALLARRNNDVQVEFLADAPDGEQFELRRVELRDGGFLAEPERITSSEVVAYDAERDVILIRAGFVATGTAPNAVCAHCGGPLRGYAALGDTKLCHPDDGLDCYRLVTLYRHPVPCGPCAYAGGGQGHMASGVEQ